MTLAACQGCRTGNGDAQSCPACRDLQPLGHTMSYAFWHAGAETLGTWLMLLFFATIGASAGSWNALLASKTIFVFILLQLSIHLLIVLGVGRACKLDMQVCAQLEMPRALRQAQQESCHANWSWQGGSISLLDVLLGVGDMQCCRSLHHSMHEVGMGCKFCGPHSRA